jgi:hypothetical protein
MRGERVLAAVVGRMGGLLRQGYRCCAESIDLEKSVEYNINDNENQYQYQYQYHLCRCSFCCPPGNCGNYLSLQEGFIFTD